MSDIQAGIEGLRALRAFIATEPALSAFVPAAEAVVSQAETIGRGDLDIEKFSADGSIPIDRNVPRIASIELAMELRKAIEAVPPFYEEGNQQLNRAYAILLGNLYLGIFCAVFQQYPEILPFGKASRVRLGR